MMPMKDLLPSSYSSEPTTIKSILRKRMLDDSFANYDFGEREITGPNKKPLIEPQECYSYDIPVQADADVQDNGNEDTLLAEDFQPGNWHVIYGREKIHKEHIGNRRLRVLIANSLKNYAEASTRREKSQIIDDVASQIQQYGGFVKKTPEGRWLSIGPVQAREKVGHSFRDAFKGKKTSNKKIMWEEAQNSIFSNLQLRESTSCASLCSSFTAAPEPQECFSQEAVPDATQSAGLPLVYCDTLEHDPLLELDNNDCGFASLISDSESSQEMSEWFAL